MYIFYFSIPNTQNLFHSLNNLCMEFLLFNGCVKSMLMNETVPIALETTESLAVFHHRCLGQYKE